MLDVGKTMFAAVSSDLIVCFVFQRWSGAETLLVVLGALEFCCYLGRAGAWDCVGIASAIARSGELSLGHVGDSRGTRCEDDGLVTGCLVLVCHERGLVINCTRGGAAQEGSRQGRGL